MRRLLLTLRFDGSRYHGWQVQPNGVTVQQALQDAVEAVTGVRAGVTGCSRTDAGVHAEMFCCTFDTDCAVPAARVPAALNASLPRDIAVYDCREVAADFHPRYAAMGKRYVYRIWNAPQRNPFLEGRALHWRDRLDEPALTRQAADFLGRHDFTAFCAAGSAVEDRVRTVRAARVDRQGEQVVFTVEADGFLYNMVRIMAGTLLDIAAGRLPPGCIPALLAGRDRTAAGRTAPAHGLYLQRVWYPPFREGPDTGHSGQHEGKGGRDGEQTGPAHTRA